MKHVRVFVPFIFATVLSACQTTAPTTSQNSATKAPTDDSCYQVGSRVAKRECSDSQTAAKPEPRVPITFPSQEMGQPR